MSLTKGINVLVTKKTSGVIESDAPVTIKNIPTISSNITKLQQLSDVDITQETDGSALVYDATSNNYVVKLLDLSHVSGILDGGNF
jgi:hypothetical protein